MYQAATRRARRVFISSTSVDLLGYREKVRDAILGLEDLPIATETFSALSGPPADECMKLAAGADAVVCVVAHRYGYVPPKELGGDGERSITWLEVDAAKNAKKPIFAFIVDPKAEWTQAKEQDRLVSEPEKASEVEKAIQKLEEFKAYLEREHTRKSFKNPDELATLVTATLAKLALQHDQTLVATARVWQPLFCHALQPAQHFRGRHFNLQELKNWLQAPVTPDRVISVVAAGGTGKTALVQQALKEATRSDRAGLFLWSFDEEPYPDAFLRAAYLYFTGEKDTPTDGLLERLQLALSGDTPHVLVLDGLERIQSEGALRRRGELEDLQLKRLVRALAGGVGAARALVTSRFSLIDLEEFNGQGHRAILLDDLERLVAFDVLRAWKVKGDDEALTNLLQPLNTNGFYHALSVAVLGSYLGNLAEGDPTRAPEFSLEDAKESDPKARRLSRILEQYAKALSPVERDLLARLSLFPRGVKVELLGWIVQAGGEVAGALIGLEDRLLVKHLERLKTLGLVFRYEANQQVVYSAHPFLRDFFRNLLGTKPEYVHESVRVGLTSLLESRPLNYPTDPAVLDQYERLIEESMLAGRTDNALEVYAYALGEYSNLVRVLGDNVRCLRIVQGLVVHDYSIKPFMTPDQRAYLVNTIGRCSRSLGDLHTARMAYSLCRQYHAHNVDTANESVDAQTLAQVELDAGSFPKALEYARNAVFLANQVDHQGMMIAALVYRATTQFFLGSTSSGFFDFQHATELRGSPLFGLQGLREATCKLLCGDRSGAYSQTKENRAVAIEAHACACDALLVRLLVFEDFAEANRVLQAARAFANPSGDIDLQLQCFHAACELGLHLGNFSQAIAEAEAGILLADTCGFGKFSIDLRLVLAETLLTAGDAHKALKNARNALDRSEDKDCQYAWGNADGLHFCGLAHQRLGEIELARQRLTAALEFRERLGHGRTDETRRALASLPPVAAPQQ